MKPVFAAVPAVLVAMATLGGCASSMSGLGGSESLSCKAPEGVICTSVSGVYANAATIAARAAATQAPAAPASYSANAAALTRDKPATPSATVIRSGPRVLRLWIAPWEDSDGDLHEESAVHVLVDNGRWLMDPVRAVPRNRMDAAAPPLTVRGDNTVPKPAAETPVSGQTLPMPPGIAPPINALPR